MVGPATEQNQWSTTPNSRASVLVAGIESLSKQLLARNDSRTHAEVREWREGKRGPGGGGGGGGWGEVGSGGLGRPRTA